MFPNELFDFLSETIPNKLPVLIKGHPGIGKSEIIEAAAKKANAETIVFHPVISDPTDFKGLPYAKDGNADFLPYGDLKKLIDAKKLTVAFFDDLGQAPVSVQASCFKPNEKIMTREGAVCIKDIRDGDFVLTGNNQFEEVSEVFEREYSGELCCIRTENCLEIQPSPEHPIYILRKRDLKQQKQYKEKPGQEEFDTDWFAAEVIKTGDYLGVPIPEPFVDIKKIESHKNTRQIEYYKLDYALVKILAAYCACGRYTENGGKGDMGSIILELPYSQERSADTNEFLKAIEENKKSKRININYLLCPGVKQKDVEITSFRFAEFVKKHCGKDKYDKKIPDFILYHKDLKWLELFIRTYQKFSGWQKLFKEKISEIKYFTNSKEFALQLQLGFTRFNTFAFCSNDKKKAQSGRFLKHFDTENIFTVSLKDSEGLRNFRTDYYKINAKSEPFKYQGIFWTRVTDHSKTQYNGKLYNIEVPGSHTYTVSNIIVHNCMQLLRKREIGGKRVSDHVVFMAATNEKSDNAGVKSILEPVKSRFCSIIKLEPNVVDWTKWAIKNKISIETIAFIRGFPDYLNGFETTPLIQNTPSPRTIEHADKLFELFKNKNENILYEGISGACGTKYAVEFIAFVKSMQELPTKNEIINYPQTCKIPGEISLKFAITTMLAANTDDKNIGPFVEYIKRFDREFQLKYFTDIIDRYPDLGNTKIYTEWLLENKELFAA